MYTSKQSVLYCAAFSVLIFHFRLTLLALLSIMIQVHRDLLSLPTFTNAVITIGTFDGVHAGHQQIIKQLIAEADAIGGETVIITFYPHPRKIINEGKVELKVLNTLQEKIERLSAYGVQHLVVVDFNEKFSQQTAEEYVKKFLVDTFHPHTIIIGYDHKFGKQRLGDYHLLEDLGEKYGYKVKEIPEHILHEVIISSTKIREAVQHHDVEKANKFLGYNYFFEGTIIEGNKLGRTIGYPTANIALADSEKIVPGHGVYAVKVLVKGQEYCGMMNIGTRPTVNGLNRSIEVNIFEFDEEVYGETIRVSVHNFIREEQKFSGLPQLKEQLALDKQSVLQLLKPA